MSHSRLSVRVCQMHDMRVLRLEEEVLAGTEEIRVNDLSYRRLHSRGKFDLRYTMRQHFQAQLSAQAGQLS